MRLIDVVELAWNERHVYLATSITIFVNKRLSKVSK